MKNDLIILAALAYVLDEEYDFDIDQHYNDEECDRIINAIETAYPGGKIPESEIIQLFKEYAQKILEANNEENQ